MNCSRPTAAGLAIAALLGISACASPTDTDATEPRVASRSSTADTPATQRTKSAEVPGSTAPPTTSKAKPPESSSAAASTPASTAAPTSTTAAPVEQDSSPLRAQRAQIPAKRLPGFNDEWSWTDVRRVQNRRSLCMQSTMVAVGAVKESGTEFTSTASKTASAVQITGVFPDEHTAMTAVAVLTAWQNECAEHAKKHLELKSVKVSRAHEVPTAVEAGRQLMVTYRPVPGEPDSVWFNSEGFVRDGDTITYLVYKSAGQDYNYELGQEPIDRGLAVAGDYLRRTRGS